MCVINIEQFHRSVKFRSEIELRPKFCLNNSQD